MLDSLYKGPPDIESDLIEEIEGVWTGGEKGAIFFIKNYGENKVRIAALDWKRDGDESGFKIVQEDMVLCHDIFRSERPLSRGGLLFFRENMFREDPINPEEDEDNLYFFKYLISDNCIIVWQPSVKIFKDLIASGEIAGKVELNDFGDTIFLDVEASEIILRMEEDSRSEQGGPFMHAHPQIFRKIAPLP